MKKEELVEVGDLDYEKAKIKVTMYIDGAVLKAIKSQAHSEGSKYQTLINRTLREMFLEEVPLRKTVLDLQQRVAKLESNGS